MAKAKRKVGRPLRTVKAPNSLVIRGVTEWREWLGELAEHLRIKPTQVIDVALADLAKREKFRAPPKRL